MAATQSRGQLDELLSSIEQLTSIVEGISADFPEGVEGTPSTYLEHIRTQVVEARRIVDTAAAVAAQLIVSVDAAIAAWDARAKYTPEGVGTTADRLRRLAAERPQRARSSLFTELAEAVQQQELDAAIVLVDRSGPWADLPDSLSEELAGWRSGDLQRGRDAVGTLTRLVTSTHRHRSDAAVRSLAVTGAWLDHQLGDDASAVDLLDTAVQTYPQAARLLAERAGLRLVLGRPTDSADDAQRAIEIAADDPAGYVQAGAVAEAAGQFREARAWYEEAARRQSDADPAWDRGASFLQPTGLLLMVWADHLATLGRSSDALRVVERSIGLGVVGTTPYPDADAHDLRWRLLRQLDVGPVEVAEAALEAGKRQLWNGAPEQAQVSLRAATEGGSAVPEAGWYLASSLMAPDDLADRRVEQAEAVWDDWLREVGPPTSQTAWAYAVRAAIADHLSGVDGRADSGVTAWGGILLCEKALVLEDRETMAWTRLSECFRTLSLSALALEAVEAGYAVNPDDRYLLGERLAVLTDAGHTEDALATLDRIPDAEQDPWLSAIKSVLLERMDRPAEALPLLDLPLQGAWNLGWYHRLKAFCLVGLGRFDEAIEEVSASLEDDSATNWTGTRLGRQVEALCILGRFSEAEATLHKAMDDQSLGDAERAFYAMLLALSTGEVEEAERRLTDLVQLSAGAFEMNDNLRTLGQTFALMNHVGLEGAEARAAFLEHARAVVAESVPPRRTADDEVSTTEARLATDHEPGSDPRLAVRAVRARRAARAGRWAEAAHLYLDLTGTRFDPESGPARVAALERGHAESVAAGDVPRASELHEQLAAEGRPPSPFVELSQAHALRAAGDYAAALDVLRDLEPRAAAPAESLLVSALLGDTALVLGQFDVATASLTRALAASEELGEPMHSAQLAVRLACAVAGRRDLPGVVDHLLRAVRLWSDAGAWNARTLLEHELDGVIRTLSTGADSDLLHLLTSARRQLDG